MTIAMTREVAFEAINSERDYQDGKWGGTASSGRKGRGALDRTLDEFAVYVLEQAEQLRHLAGTTDEAEPKLEVVRKVAALAVACMEAHGAPFRLPPIIIKANLEQLAADLAEADDLLSWAPGGSRSPIGDGCGACDPGLRTGPGPVVLDRHDDQLQLDRAMVDLDDRLGARKCGEGLAGPEISLEATEGRPFCDFAVPEAPGLTCYLDAGHQGCCVGTVWQPKLCGRSVRVPCFPQDCDKACERAAEFEPCALPADHAGGCDPWPNPGDLPAETCGSKVGDIGQEDPCTLPAHHDGCCGEPVTSPALAEAARLAEEQLYWPPERCPRRDGTGTARCILTAHHAGGCRTRPLSEAEVSERRLAICGQQCGILRASCMLEPGHVGPHSPAGANPMRCAGRMGVLGMQCVLEERHEGLCKTTYQEEAEAGRPLQRHCGGTVGGLAEPCCLPVGHDGPCIEREGLKRITTRRVGRTD